MEVKTISDLSKFDEIIKDIENDNKIQISDNKIIDDDINEDNTIIKKRQQTPLSTFIQYINNNLVHKINNKKDTIKILLDKSINALNQKINYYNVIIKSLQVIDRAPYNHDFSNISINILFTNTCNILYYKINNNLYNLYKFVENEFIDDFNILLLSCLLSLYYIDNNDNKNYDYNMNFYFDSNLRNLYLFKYSHYIYQ